MTVSTSHQPITAVIPTYNGLPYLKRNLIAALKCLRDGDQLVVVDDASSDLSASWLLKKFGAKLAAEQNQGKIYQGLYQNSNKKITIQILVNSANCRFAESCNRGVRLARFPLIFLLNNDVVPHPHVLQYLTPYFSPNNPNSKLVFAVGCLENDLNGEPAGKNKLWFEKGTFMHSKANHFVSGATGWVSGGSGLFSKSKWQQLNGFDVGFYPAYWEDIDLSFRAKKKGWLVLFEEQAVVKHHHQSTNTGVFGQAKINLISWKNADKFTWKNGSILQKASFLLWKPYWWWKRQSLVVS